LKPIFFIFDEGSQAEAVIVHIILSTLKPTDNIIFFFS